MSVRAINMWVPGRDCVCVKRRMGGGGFGVWGWGGLETPFFPPALMQTGIASVMIVYGICALQRIVRRSDIIKPVAIIITVPLQSITAAV